MTPTTAPETPGPQQKARPAAPQLAPFPPATPLPQPSASAENKHPGRMVGVTHSVPPAHGASMHRLASGLTRAVRRDPAEGSFREIHPASELQDRLIQFDTRTVSSESAGPLNTHTGRKTDRKSTRLNSSHRIASRMPSSA